MWITGARDRRDVPLDVAGGMIAHGTDNHRFGLEAKRQEGAWAFIHRWFSGAGEGRRSCRGDDVVFCA